MSTPLRKALSLREVLSLRERPVCRSPVCGKPNRAEVPPRGTPRWRKLHCPSPDCLEPVWGSTRRELEVRLREEAVRLSRRAPP